MSRMHALALDFVGTGIVSRFYPKVLLLAVAVKRAKGILFRKKEKNIDSRGGVCNKKY